MNERIVCLRLLAAACVVILLFAGCRATTREISPDAAIHYDETYDFTDKKAIVSELVTSLTGRPPLCCRDGRPVIVVYGVANRTSEHIDTSGITDDIRSRILETGKARFVNKTQRANLERELAYQYGGHVTPETRMERARQIGAQYMLTGTLRSIKKRQPDQVRLKRKTLQYYSLTLELTDIETGLIEWSDSVEIVREAAKPFIGW